MPKPYNRSLGSAFTGDTFAQALTIIASMYLIYLSYQYLAGMKTCKCVNQKSAQRLKTLELVLLVLSGISLLLLGVPTFNPKLMKYKMVSMLIVPVVILFYLYFIYNVNSFKNSFSNSCGCAMQWERWIVYVQYGVYVFEIMLLILLALYVMMRWAMQIVR